ncbi:hypothetical protein EBB07_24280 [Paenibacillaceae bacterium]|nr:hypothetical protein EBB07_24280 [Paenibacillaceae bacterium]
MFIFYNRLISLSTAWKDQLWHRTPLAAQVGFAGQRGRAALRGSVRFHLMLLLLHEKLSAGTL